MSKLETLAQIIATLKDTTQELFGCDLINQPLSIPEWQKIQRLKLTKNQQN